MPRTERPEHRQDAPRKEVTSLESLRSLYLAERQRRENIRSRLSIPVSIVSFSIFGYVALAQYFDAARTDPVTLGMEALLVGSIGFLFAAMVHLARVERFFMTREMDQLEDLQDSDGEYTYFESAYFTAREENARASRLRAHGFILLLVALGLFVLAVALLPIHLMGTDVHGRGETESAEPAPAAARLPGP